MSLTFALGDRVFKVRRAMGFERAAKRGGGVTRQPPEATLECLAGDPRFETVASPRKVDAEVERLLGLPYEQFTRIIVLPQGEFRDLLLSRAEDRERLLERLFGTELYKTIEAELRDVEKGLERALGEGRARVDAALRGAGAASRDDLAALRADVDVRCAPPRAAPTAAEAALREAEDAAATREGGRARNRERHAAREARVALEERAVEVAPAHAHPRPSAPRTATTRPRAARPREGARRAIGAPSTPRAPPSDASRARPATTLRCRPRASAPSATSARPRASVAARREQLQRELDEVESSRARSTPRARGATRAEAQVRDLDAQAERAAATQRDKQRALDEGRRAAQRSSAALLRVEEVDRSEALQSRRRALEEQRARGDPRAPRGRARRASPPAIASARRARPRERARAHERARPRGGARARPRARRAPCPVCGEPRAPVARPDGGCARRRRRRGPRRRSTAHDEALAALGRAEADQAKLEGELDALTRQLDAQRDADGATADELDEARRAAARALDEVRRMKRAADDAERSLAAVKRDLAAHRGRARAGRARRIAESAATIAQLEPRVATARARASRPKASTGPRSHASLDEARALDDEARPEAVEAIRARARRPRRARRSRAGAAVEHAERERDEAEPHRRRGERDLAEALAAQGFARRGRADGGAAHRAGASALRDAVASHRVERARVTATTAALGADEPAGDVGAREAEAAASARAALAEAQRAVGSLVERAGQLAAVAARAAAWAGDGDEAERRWKTARAVSDAVNGRHEGKTRLSRYVLLEQFDRVAACASARLDVMSDGRFALRRRESRQTGGEFELVVDDAYAGSVERPVATLSGGEMFMASLAMALGLCDVVQAWAGGVRVESLFVDEGFGTLDEEALDKAVSVLEQLGESRRMVGVVSHVPELRKRIPARLEVVRSERGAATRASLRGRHRS